MRWIAGLVCVLAGCGGDAAKYVGTWHCKASTTKGQTQHLATEQKIEVFEGGREDSTGTVAMTVPGEAGQSIAVRWSLAATGTYAFEDGKLCEKITTMRLTPLDEPTRAFEKSIGTTFEAIFPKGNRHCVRYEFTDQQLTVHSEDAGPMICTRKP